MALIEFKNKPDTTTAVNASNLNFNFKEVMNLIYPINSIIIKADNTDYSDFLGFEWERTLVGKVAVGIDSEDTDFDTIGKTGGEKEHTLTVNETPSHNHGTLVEGQGGSSNYALRVLSTGAGGGFNKMYSSSAGGDQPHNNLQPYQIVAFWKRVA